VVERPLVAGGSFYAITVERKLRKPASLAISERARALFS
jgi:hypothetical protein